MPNPSIIFDRSLLRRRRDRAAPAIADHDFLLKEMATRLADRLGDFKRGFPLALDLGAHHGVLAGALSGRGGIETLVQTDMSETMIRASSPPMEKSIVADEEWLPFAENTFDLIISAGSLHWVNDLPGAMAQIRHALKKDGLFMATLPGGGTLKELRQSLEQAELRLSGGVSPRVSPYLEVRDAGALLQRTGFALPVADSEIITIAYEHSMDLIYDLRGMGEANTLLSREKRFTNRALFFEAMDYYEKHFVDGQGRVTATIELVTMTGWKA